MTRKLLMLSWISPLRPPSAGRLAAFRRFTQPPVSACQHQHAGCRRKRRQAEPGVQRDQEDRGARHQEHVRGELDERLREED